MGAIMSDAWQKAYVYGHYRGFTRRMSGRVAHVVTDYRGIALCGIFGNQLSCDPRPYAVCKNCLRRKSAKELAL